MTTQCLACHRSRASAWLTALLLLAPCGCATIASGEYAHSIDAQGHLAKSPTTGLGLLISGSEVTDASSQYFGLVALTLENQSSDWVRIEKMNVTFGGTMDASVVIPTGDDIVAWDRATQQRNAVRDANTEAVLGTLALAAAVTAAASQHKPAAALGAAVEVGVIGGLVAHEVAQGDNAPGSARYPGEHLLSMPLSIPPGLFAKRWVLLSTPPGIHPDCVTEMLLTYETDSRQTERVLLSFRHKISRSEWQRDACERSWHR